MTGEHRLETKIKYVLSENLEFPGHITEKSGGFPIVNFNDCGLAVHLWETTTTRRRTEQVPNSSCCKQLWQ